MAIFNASIYAPTGSTITVRIRDDFSWWNGTSWSTTLGDAYEYPTSVRVTGEREDYYYAALSIPTSSDGEMTAEYLRNGLVVGEDVITDSGGTPGESPNLGTTGYNPTLITIVKGALRMVGAYASTDQPRPEQLNDAIAALQLMLKSWQSDNLPWLRRRINVTPVADQDVYTLGPTGTAYAGSRPTRIYQAYRRNADEYDVPLSALSRQDYQSLTNKYSAAVPVQYYYNPQLGDGELYIWPVWDGTSDVAMIILDCDRVISDILNDTENFDAPPEWWEVIKYGLAYRISPEYGLILSERQLLQQEYLALREHALSASTDLTSTFFAFGRQ